MPVLSVWAHSGRTGFARICDDLFGKRNKRTAPPNALSSGTSVRSGIHIFVLSFTLLLVLQIKHGYNPVAGELK
jgi:hypothetical protein